MISVEKSIDCSPYQFQAYQLTSGTIASLCKLTLSKHFFEISFFYLKSKELNGVDLFRLVSALAGRANFQLQYQLVFCLWCLTFNPAIAERMHRHGVIPTLADILSESSKEKVIRIIIATFRV